jgi:hypothetical protein
VENDNDPQESSKEEIGLVGKVTAMQAWLEAGDLIILGMDDNENVRAGTPAEYANKWGLVDAHRRQFPALAPVGTQDTNLAGIPVDGLWISPGLECSQAGMTGLGEIAIDRAYHRLLWI